MMYCPIVRLSHVASLQPPFGVLQSGSDMQHKRLLNATARFLRPGSQDAIANTYIPLRCAHIEHQRRNVCGVGGTLAVGCSVDPCGGEIWGVARTGPGAICIHGCFSAESADIVPKAFKSNWTGHPRSHMLHSYLLGRGSKCYLSINS